MAKKGKLISVDAIQSELDGMKADVEKFNNGTQAAGPRLRKGAQAIKALCQTLRNDVTAIKNAR